MWSDTLYAAERAPWVRLFLWATASVVVGTAVWAIAAQRTDRSALLQHFALQTAAWGLVDLGIGVQGWRSLAYRDVAAYTTLDRFLWLNIGLDIGYVGVGMALLACGWNLGRRLGLVGAGLGVMVQGAALAALDGWLVVILNRIQIG
jgi:hypothetical protein